MKDALASSRKPASRSKQAAFNAAWNRDRLIDTSLHSAARAARGCMPPGPRMLTLGFAGASP